MIQDLLNDPAEGAAPRMAQLSPLLGAGVPLDAIIAPWSVRVSRIRFPEPWRYEPSPLGELGYIFAVIDDEIIDLVGWHPRAGRIGTRLGIGAALGEGQIGRDGAGTTGLPIPVWRTPLGWLNAERCGLVIADPEVAAIRLAGLSLVAEDIDHGRHVKKTLSRPEPQISVPRPMQVAA